MHFMSPDLKYISRPFKSPVFQYQAVFDDVGFQVLAADSLECDAVLSDKSSQN
jgi:hypothetical protein